MDLREVSELVITPLDAPFDAIRLEEFSHDFGGRTFISSEGTNFVFLPLIFWLVTV